MVNIYTDTSVAHGKGVNTTFVVDDVNYIGCETFVHCNVTTSLEGELHGIRDSLEFVYKRFAGKTEELVLWCDSDAAIAYVDKDESDYHSLVMDIRRLCKQLPVTLKLIRGHQLQRNPNKVVDAISNSVLRYTVKGQI